MKIKIAVLVLFAVMACVAHAQSYYNQTAADFLRGGPAQPRYSASTNKIMLKNNAPGTVQYAYRFGRGAWKTINLYAGNQITHSGYGTPSVKFSNLQRLVTYTLRPKSVNSFVLAGPRRLDLIADANVMLR